MGRGEELDTLIERVREMRTHGPQVVLLSGEAGVGKTRVVREFAAQVKGEDRLPVWFGRCYEDFTHPYLPFLEDLLPRALDLISDPAVGDLDVIRMLIRQGTEAAPPTDVAARLRLATPRLLRALAAVEPFVFVIEDLHWADSATIGLLSHLVFSLADDSGSSPGFLILCTFREPEDGTPLAVARGRIAREPISRSLALAGLDEWDTRQLIESCCGAHSSQQLVREVMELTAGNPLYVSEVLDRLAASGHLLRIGDSVVASSPLQEMEPPTEVGGSFANRFSALDGVTKRTLSAAAVVDGTIRAELLTSLLGAPAGSLAPILAHCVETGFLVGGGPSYTFGHPLMRTVCYTAIPLAERQRLHARAASELERAEDQRLLLERARHLVAAGTYADPAELIDVATAAAERAAELGAWTSAAALYDAVAERAVDLDPLELASLHDLAASAFDMDQDPDLAGRHWERSVQIYDALERPLADASLDRVAAALNGVTRSQVSHGDQTLEASTRERLERFLDECGDRAPSARGVVLSTLSEWLFRQGQGEEAESVAGDALRAAAESGDAVLTARVQQTMGIAKLQTLHDGEALGAFEESMAAARSVDDEERYVRSAARSVLPLLSLGRLTEVAGRASEIDQRSVDGRWVSRCFAEVGRCAAAAIRGDWGAVEQHAATGSQLSSRANYPDGAHELLPNLIYARLQQGEWEEARDAVELWAGRDAAGRGWAFYQLIAASAGDRPAVMQAIAEAPRRARWRGRAAHGSLPTFAALIELAAAVSDPSMFEYPQSVLRNARERGRVVASPWPVLIDRLCGVAASGCGDALGARHYLDAAVERATELDAQPELGLARLERARLLVASPESGARGQAADELAQAVRIFGELSMAPALARARSLAEELGVTVGPVPSPAGVASEHGLTRRQLDVLRKLAAGLTNDEIAEALMIRPATARRHVANVYERIGVSNRASATRYCIEHGLME